MDRQTIVRAWRDPVFRGQIPVEELGKIPMHPSGRPPRDANDWSMRLGGPGDPADPEKEAPAEGEVADPRITGTDGCNSAGCSMVVCSDPCASFGCTGDYGCTNAAGCHTLKCS